MIHKITNTEFKFSLLRNSIVQVIWWAVFFPGFFSTDSFGAVRMAKSGDLTNSYTASWAIYVRIFSLHGNAIWLLTLLNGLVLVFAVTRFAYSIFSYRTAATASFLLTLTPVVVGMGITLWHDIPMTAGLLLLTSFFTIFLKGERIGRLEIVSQLLFGAILISFRPNGLPTLLVFSTAILIFKFRKRLIKYLITGIATSAFVTLVGSQVILGLSPINDYFAQEWMRNDISCFANTTAGIGFVEKNIPNIGNTKSWKSQAACTFLNNASITNQNKIDAQEFVPSAWLKLVKKEPAFVLSTHLKRNAYLIPIPLFGIPTTPFLHSTIEFKDQGIEWAFPSLAEQARTLMRLWNALRGITGWAGLWALVTLLLLLPTKKKELLPTLVMSVSLIGILFVFSPIPDGRYALFALIAGQIALIGKCVEWACRTPPDA